MDLKIVQLIKNDISNKDIEYLKQYPEKKKEVKQDYDSITKLGNDIFDISNSLNIDIPIDYTNKVTQLTIRVKQIQTLKANIILNHITMERKYWNAYYTTLHRYKETKSIGTKHEWDAAFNLALKEILHKDIFNKLEIWKHLINTAEELVQSTMEIIHSGKKSLTVLMDKKW